MHYLVLREVTAITTNSSGYFDFSRSANAVEGLGNYSSSVTSLYETVRIDWLRITFYPNSNTFYNLTLAALSPVTAIYSGTDNYTHTYSGIGTLQDARFHPIGKTVTVLWRMPLNSANALTFYPTTGTGISPQISSTLGGVLAYFSYIWTSTLSIGLFTAEYGLSLKGFKQ
jgi:hypothetical protein